MSVDFLWHEKWKEQVVLVDIGSVSAFCQFLQTIISSWNEELRTCSEVKPCPSVVISITLGNVHFSSTAGICIAFASNGASHWLGKVNSVRVCNYFT